MRAWQFRARLHADDRNRVRPPSTPAPRRRNRSWPPSAYRRAGREGEDAPRPSLSAERVLDLLRSLQAAHADAAVCPAGGEPSPPRIVSQSKQPARGISKHSRRFGWPARIPEYQRRVVGSRRQGVSIWCEGHRPHGAPVPAHHTRGGTRCPEVPDTHGGIRPGRSQYPSVRRERERRHPRAVALQFAG
jgi:hypothetical protein